MKNVLLFSLTFFISTGLFAQTQRVVLYEEFSGENCGPCAAVNPGLNDFVEQYGSDVILLKYQTNIPRIRISLAICCLALFYHYVSVMVDPCIV